MQALLKRFSQEVDLSNAQEVKYFLVFDINGKEERLPVQQETVTTLTALLYGIPPDTGAEPVPDFPEEQTQEKVGSFAPSIPEGAESYEAPEEEEFDEEEEPLNEDEVPGL